MPRAQIIALSPKGQLPGYHLADDKKVRRRALRRAVRAAAGAPRRAAAVKRRLNVLRIYRKNADALRRRARRLEALRPTPPARGRQARALRARARQNRRECKTLTDDMKYLDRTYGLGTTGLICR